MPVHRVRANHDRFFKWPIYCDVPIVDMLGVETVLIENVAANVTRQTTNLLQLIISQPLIPS